MSIATWCTRRKIGPVVVVDEADPHVMDKTKGTEVVPTTFPDPLEVGGESRGHRKLARKAHNGMLVL